MSAHKKARVGPPNFHRKGVRREEWIAKRIELLRARLVADSTELLALVNPTQQEMQELEGMYEECSHHDLVDYLCEDRWNAAEETIVLRQMEEDAKAEAKGPEGEAGTGGQG